MLEWDSSNAWNDFNVEKQRDTTITRYVFFYDKSRIALQKLPKTGEFKVKAEISFLTHVSLKINGRMNSVGMKSYLDLKCPVRCLI